MGILNSTDRGGGSSDLKGQRPFIAVDIGTTTVAMTNGIQTVTFENPQREKGYGHDVISRIRRAVSGDADKMQRILWDALFLHQKELFSGSDSSFGGLEPVFFVISANTAMEQILCGDSCEGLQAAPFTAKRSGGFWPGETFRWLDDEERRWGDGSRGQGETFRRMDDEVRGSGEMSAAETMQTPSFIAMPGISPFVGGDIVSGMYALNLDRTEEMTLFLDLGTNGEIVLGNREGFYSCSTAAGPAFEAANISCGRAAVPGAVGSVSIRNRRPRLGMIPPAREGNSSSTEGNSSSREGNSSSTEGNSSSTEGNSSSTERNSSSTEGYLSPTEAGMLPTGLCGSGVIDLVYELLQNRLIDQNGTFYSERDLREGYILFRRDARHTLRFLQEDIRAVQTAKAAVRAGIEILLEEAKVSYDGVGQVLIGGAFGAHISPEKLCGIGLLPEEFLKKTRAVGNTSLAGAWKLAERFDKIEDIMGSLQGEEVKRLKKIPDLVTPVSLAEHPDFEDRFIKAMGF